MTIGASATVAAPREAVFAFLAELHNHWTLAGDVVELVEVTGNGSVGTSAIVAMRGPLGIRRRARTEVLEHDPPARLGGTARLGDVTEARVRWDLEPAPDGDTLVRLSAHVDRAGRLDRILLAAGGRLWLRRMFAATLARLADQLAGDRVPEGDRVVAGSEPVE